MAGHEAGHSSGGHQGGHAGGERSVSHPSHAACQESPREGTTMADHAVTRSFLFRHGHSWLDLSRDQCINSRRPGWSSGVLAPAVIPPSLINTHLSLLATGALHGPKTGMGLLSEQTYAGGSNPPPQALVRCCTHLEPPQTSIPCAFDPPPPRETCSTTPRLDQHQHAVS